MKLGKYDLEQQAKKKKAIPFHSIFIFCFKCFTILFLFLIIFGTSISVGMVRGIIDNAPKLDQTNVQPAGYASHIYDRNGILIQDLVSSGTNREEVLYEQIPKHLINAVIAIEDTRFLTHNGIDIKGIFRAAFTALTTGTFSEGASTITQQLVKNNILDGGYETNLFETFERKLQEQYLALELEKQMGKEQILQNYLNTINLGSNCLGVQTAARRYFGKSVSDLDLAECTVLAAITSNPTYYNPITHPQNNQKRRVIVLEKMLEQHLISSEEMENALDQAVYSRILTATSYSSKSPQIYSYFTDTIYHQVCQDLQTICGYSPSQAHTLLYSGGLEIITTMDSRIQSIVEEELNNPENYYNTANEPLEEYSISYSLSVLHADQSLHAYNETDVVSFFKNTLNQTMYRNLYADIETIQADIALFKEYVVSEQDVILSEQLTPILQPQAASIVMDPYTGEVLAIVGGRGEKTGSLTLNRATDSERQPGSCFHVLADLAPALDTSGATLATTFYDGPYSLQGQPVMNWWGTQYLGYNNIRQAIKYSMNIISAKCFQTLVEPSLSFHYLTNFGFSTLVDSDKSSLLALGTTTEGIYQLELAAAYAAIANDGCYNKPVFYTKVLDRSGRIILENTPEPTRILKSSTAALLTDSMKESLSATGIYSQYGIEPTATGYQLTTIEAAAKSGTTTDSNDIWFVGYTPYYLCSVWSGYDSSKTLGTNQNYHKQIWNRIMERIHETCEPKAFSFSEPLEKHAICSKSGLLAIEGVCNGAESNAVVYTESFAPGTAPTEFCNRHYTLWICQDSGLSASSYCPSDRIYQKVFFRIDSADLNSSVTTLDTAYLAPSALQSCTSHTEKKKNP